MLSSTPTDPAASSTAQQGYIGNVNSKKFHLPSCANLPCGEEPDSLLQLRGGHCGRVQPVLELHQVKSISNKQRPADLPWQGAAVFWDHFFRFLKSTGSVVHRFRKRYAASLGWRWRVKMPFCCRPPAGCPRWSGNRQNSTPAHPVRNRSGRIRRGSSPDIHSGTRHSTSRWGACVHRSGCRCRTQ